MSSCARFLCNRARELLEREALEALDVCVLVEITHHVHRCPLFIYELEELALLIARFSLSADSLFLSAGPLTLPAFSVTLFLRLHWPSVLSPLPRRLPPLLSPQPQLVQASALYIMVTNGGIWTTSDFSKSDLSRTTRTSRALRAFEAESLAASA